MISLGRLTLALALSMPAFSAASDSVCMEDPACYLHTVPPYLLVYGNRKQLATPRFVVAHKAYLETLPFDGITVYMADSDENGRYPTRKISHKVMNNAELPYATIASVLEPLRGDSFDQLTKRFVVVYSDKPADFFDDWSGAIQNFGNLARAAGEAGFTGIFFDNEQYFTRWGDYPTDIDYPSKSLEEYQAQARLRGRQIMAAMVAEWPEIEVLTFHGPYISEPAAPTPPFPPWQSHNELLGALFVGFVEAAPPSATVIDGGEIYELRTNRDFSTAYEWQKETIASDIVDSAFLPRFLRATWPQRVSIAYGLYDRPFRGKDMNASTMRTTVANALRTADRYVWLFQEGRTFYRPQGEPDAATHEWIEAVTLGKEDALGPFIAPSP